ncbi:hypothetical protein [Paenibacillus sp. CGMCC 1.18879]|nr:hypothetical protein [Paenibacillus sp. CGMCC 1.18879]
MSGETVRVIRTALVGEGGPAYAWRGTPLLVWWSDPAHAWRGTS